MQIRRVSVNNFRGIRNADWVLPANRFVCLVGPGDSTKTTLLDVIALVLSPRWNVPFTDADFHDCDTTKQIVLQVVVGDLDGAMIRDDAFGLDLCGLTADGNLVHDPIDGAEACVMLQLAVGADLEPQWTVVRPGATEDGPTVSARKREAFGLFRIDERVDTHLRWGRSSALARLTASAGAGDAVTRAHRAARVAVFDAPASALHDAAKQVELAAQAIGASAFTSLRPGLDPVASSTANALLLHDGNIPLSHMGLGTRRLTSVAIQDNAMEGNNILLIDEVEHGLDPHRLLHLVRQIKRRTAPGVGQVIATTHSPLVVQALQAADICVVRSTGGVTTAVTVPSDLDDVQASMRACPAAVLARKIIVGEGKTEVGIVRTFLHAWDIENSATDRPTHAALGVSLVDGVGKTAPTRAKVFQKLGYTTLLLVDNDDRNFDKEIEECVAAGVEVVRWRHGNSTEAENTSSLDLAGIVDLLDEAVDIKGADPVRDAVIARLPSVSAPGSLEPDLWLSAGRTLDEIRTAVAQAAGAAGWFKREDHGERLGELLLARWPLIESTTIGQGLAGLRRFTYGEEAGVGHVEA